MTPSTPQGLLVQVTSVSTDDSGATVAAVRPAGLQEALGDSDIALSAPLDSPWWTLGFSLSAEAALHISVLFVHVDASARFPVLSAVLAEAAGGATGSPPVITTTRLPDGTTGHAYSTQPTTADHRTGSWALAGGSLPPGLTLSGYTVSGTPAATGTAAFTLRFTDTQGHTVQAPGTLTVYAGSAAPTTGRVSGRITETQGHPLAGVAVSALECGCAGAPVIASGTTGADGRLTKNPASAPATRPSVSATAPAHASPAVIGRRSP
ncbi:putative Ig domain-containing protein [Streptomyces sp. NBC_01477]|uniref:putative Ig domain-containing protein n=1 Tax=Streptomyces sp. NBC_01477 TaxID=2976015 RepID=UPI002E3510A9|nr:putative Ig domain-containing protein [Streptomyces sp. NBC_01477]